MRWLALLVAFGSAVPATAASHVRPAGAFKAVAETERVSYFSVGRNAVDVKSSEKLLDRLSGVFGPIPRGSRLLYYRHPSSAGVQEQTGVKALGVTDIETGRIDSTLAYHPHELVHAVAGRLGRPPVFFEEGLAVALTSGGRWGARNVDEVARQAFASGVRLEPFIEAFTENDPELGYPLAGSFVAYLLDVHGIEAVRGFFAACGATPRRHEGAFQRAFGRTVANASIAWQASLAQGRSATWRWNDPTSWPGTLQRDAARGVATAAVVRAEGREPAVEGRVDRDQATVVGEVQPLALQAR